MANNTHLPVDILLPERWWQKPLYRLNKDLWVNGHMVPEGFISDGATVPRIFWPIFPPIGRYTPEAFLHDHRLTVDSRKVADYKFLRALKAAKIPAWRYQTMFVAVRFNSKYVAPVRELFKRLV